MNIFRSGLLPFRTAAARAPRAPCRAVCANRTTVFSRGFASNTEEDASKPPKPKASTPLRRSASASLPIRSNPTPTRSSIQSVFTLTTAERYSLARISTYLPPSSTAIHESWWVPRWSANGKEGEVFIFGNGSIVCWGLGEAEAERFAQEVVSRSRAEIAPLKEPETEDLEFVTDPSE